MTAFLEQHPEVNSAIHLFEIWTESQRVNRNQPGLSVGIVLDQELIWSRGFGFADEDAKTPAKPDTIYRIASISKVFTATAILQLRDRGRLRLDDPIQEHLPWFEIQPVGKDAPPITIWHLLTHTSGLPREAAFPYWTDFEFPTREQIRLKLPEQRQAYPPETQWKYSNLALTLAGEIVAEASGEPYAEYIQKHILDPLEMTSTSVVLPEAHRSRLAEAYGRRMPDGARERRPFTDSRGLTPAANLSSTVEDLARFLSLQFRDGPAGGRQILRASTLREMRRVQWLKPDWKSGWGLGFGIERREGRVQVGHGGNVAGYTTRITFWPQAKIAVIVMTNADDGNPVMYANRGFDLVSPEILKATAPPGEPAQPDPAWNRYVGKYRNSWEDTEVLVLGGELVMLSPSAVDPKESMLKLRPAGQHTFLADGQEGGAEIGEPVVFELDTEGNVKRVKVGENYTFPVKE